MDHQQLGSQGTNGHLGVIFGIPFSTHIVYTVNPVHVYNEVSSLVYRVGLRRGCQSSLPVEAAIGHSVLGQGHMSSLYTISVYTPMVCTEYTKLCIVCPVCKGTTYVFKPIVYTVYTRSLLCTEATEMTKITLLRPGRRKSVTHQCLPWLGCSKMILIFLIYLIEITFQILSIAVELKIKKE